jgi:hypothetical protein
MLDMVKSYCLHFLFFFVVIDFFKLCLTIHLIQKNLKIIIYFVMICFITK